MKIVVCGNYGAKNLGDEMILEGLLKSLKNIVPDAEIVVLSGDPKETAQKYDIKSVSKFPAGPRSFLKSLFKNPAKSELKSCDYFILGGGGLFAGPNFYANIIWAVQALWAYHYKKPVIMYAQSVAEIKGKFLKYLLKKIFEKATFIAVRDLDSRAHLQKLGLTQEIYLMPDSAFNITLPDMISKKEQNKILVCLRYLKNLPTNFRQELAKFLDWLIEEKQCYLTFIDFQKDIEDDSLLNQEIIASLKNTTSAEHIAQINNSYKLLQQFLKSSFVIGMRFHSIILAVKTNTPFLALNYAPKVKNFLKTYQLDKYSLNLDEITLENLKNLYQTEIFCKQEKISSHLKKLNETLSKKHQELEKILTEILYLC